MKEISTNENEHGLWSILAILLLVSTISQVTSDLYLPSLPHMAVNLSVSTHSIQFTVTLYMIGLCLSQLIYGPMSDAFGRRRPLLFGLSLNVIGSILCWGAPNIYLLYIGRCLQGLGAGAGLVIARSMLRDLFSGETLAKYNSYQAIAGVFILSTAPVLGGYIQYHLGWRFNFAFLCGYGLVILFAFYTFISETNRYLHPENFTTPVILKNCKSLLTSTVFLRYAFCPLFAYAGILAWLTASPIVLQNVVGLNAVQFGWIYVISGLGFATGGFLNAKLVQRFKIEKMILLGFSVQLLAGVFMLFFYLLGFVNAWVIVPPIGIYMLGSSLVFPNSSAGAFGPFHKIAGTAGALFGFMQILGGAAASGIIGIVHDNNQLPMAIAFVTTALLSFIFFIALKSPNGAA